MMKKITVFIAALIALLNLRADSPLTSTDLTKGYEGSTWVKEAREYNGNITDGIMKFLSNDKGDIGEKAAVICALGWGEQATLNFSQYMQFLLENKPENKRTGNDYCCVAYLAALGNYFDVSEARTYAEQSVKLNPKSYTCNIIYALIKAQQYLDDMKNWCNVYKVCNEVRSNKDLRQDLKQEAVKGIFDYIDIYKEECK